MASGMFHIRDDEQLVEMREQPYDSEGLLQKLLEDHPQLLAGDQISSESPRRWLLIQREMGVPSEDKGCDRWSADHLFVDQDAVPTFVEVKRSNDTRIRREVVGQMLDYAANAVVHWPVERMREAFETRCQRRDVDPEIQLAEFLQGDREYEDFWQGAKTNLQAGRIRLLFVADRIPGELRRVVEFLNQQMDPAEVLAVEIKQFVGPGLRSLVPRIFGQTAQAERKKQTSSRSKRQWDAESFLHDLEERSGKSAAEVARRFIDWSRETIGEPRWGSGTIYGCFSVDFEHDGFRHVLFDCWSSGDASIRFKRLKKRPPYDDEGERRRLVERLNEIDGVAIKEPEGCPQIRLTVLEPPQAQGRFLEVMAQMGAAIRRTPQNGSAPE